VQPEARGKAAEHCLELCVHRVSRRIGPTSNMTTFEASPRFEGLAHQLAVPGLLARSARRPAATAKPYSITVCRARSPISNLRRATGASRVCSGSSSAPTC
jgi:hypothetical protein